MLFRVAILLSLAAAPALAQTDGGVADAGEPDGGVVDAGAPDPCDPSCQGDQLQFCDGDAASTLDCATLGARCGELSAAWGADCLLPVGAACDPGYGYDESRCDRAASLYCIDGACAVASAPQGQPPLSPSAGSSAADDSSTSDPFACSSCTDGSAAGVFVLAGALLRRRRRARSTQATHAVTR